MNASILQKFHIINLAEIELGSLALEHGQSADVREYGQRLVTEHERLERELGILARDLNLDLRASSSEDHGKELRFMLGDISSELREADIKLFEQIFADKVFTVHEDALAWARRGEYDASTDELKKFFRQTIVGLEQHLELAQKLKMNPMQSSNQ